MLAATEAFVSGGADAIGPLAGSVSACLVPALAVSTDTFELSLQCLTLLGGPCRHLMQTRCFCVEMAAGLCPHDVLHISMWVQEAAVGRSHGASARLEAPKAHFCYCNANVTPEHASL